MGKGCLRVELRFGENLFPVPYAKVLIKDTKGRVLFDVRTNGTGNTSDVLLEAPAEDASLTPYGAHGGSEGIFSVYDVEIPFSGGFKRKIIHGVQVFDTETSILIIEMQPVLQNDRPDENYDEIFIPLEHGIDSIKQQITPDNEGEILGERFGALDYTESEPGGEGLVRRPLANEVVIPEFITVHLGLPNSNSANMRVPFKDYLKNVASSEIYPTWPREALVANIFAQISFALNRINTAWYRSRGFNFDITNSTTVDQFFVPGRNIFENLSDIVDGIFNQFIRRQGFREPYISQYCNGTTATCPGLSQWGTVPLAESGYTAIEILRHYFPDDINIVMSNNFGAGYAVFGGASLQEGSSGSDVRKMQLYLNRISGNFPLILPIENPNGVFDEQTKEAVRTFQAIFNLVQDGIIGKKTWYQIVQIYVGVTRLAELDSEGERISIGVNPPTSVLRLNSRGADVVELQFLINFIAQFYQPVPYIPRTGVFTEATRNGVIAFQKNFGLAEDGIVGPATWNMLYTVYRAVRANMPPHGTLTAPRPTPAVTAFPGYFIRKGQNGENIRLMQRYLNEIRRSNSSIPWLKEDGVFGPVTEQAVKEFQRIFELNADGIIGPLTWERIVLEHGRMSSAQLYTSSISEMHLTDGDVAEKGYAPAARGSQDALRFLLTMGMFRYF